MTITTRHQSVAVATKLEYDNNGLIRSKTSCARGVSDKYVAMNLLQEIGYLFTYYISQYVLVNIYMADDIIVLNECMHHGVGGDHCNPFQALPYPPSQT